MLKTFPDRKNVGVLGHVFTHEWKLTCTNQNFLVFYFGKDRQNPLSFLVQICTWVFMCLLHISLDWWCKWKKILFSSGFAVTWLVCLKLIMHYDKPMANLSVAAALDCMQCQTYVPSDLLLHMRNLNLFTWRCETWFSGKVWAAHSVSPPTCTGLGISLHRATGYAEKLSVNHLCSHLSIGCHPKADSLQRFVWWETHVWGWW